MSGGNPMVWAEAPDEDGGDEQPETEAHGDLDESFAARRLRRWINGMFGGSRKSAADGEAAGREDEG